MKKLITKLLLICMICTVSLNAKTVTLHEAVATLNKSVGLLVQDNKKMQEQINLLENKIVMYEKDKQINLPQEEIELDNQIMEYLKNTK